ncbi:APC family permease [Knoellia locipacati]|uniref:Amino acid permease n=1 Tax=Knoellia locipacati TaxID=882824 RepID=A0A512T0A4_9MICO|nr:APC family permease [Knoellia locipacati]GEQ13648.1 amino acid permease [Knoellia locipacati]
MSADTDVRQSGESETKLKRGITPMLLFFFIVGDTLGAGIYTLVGSMAKDVGGAIWLPLIFALVLALLTAGTYAELITKYPHAGGAARYAERAFKKPYATFIIGWLMLSSGITTSAALANAFAGDYLKALIDLPAVPVTLVFIGALIAINLRGVRESLMANVGATVIEMTGLLIIIIVAAIVFGKGEADPSQLTTFADGVTPLQGAFAATITAFFSFLGFEAAANMAEEVKQPSKAYPRALFGAIITAGVIYLLIALGAAAVVPTGDLAESEGPLLEVIKASGLSFPPWLFGAIALVAIGNGALLFMVMASRATYGLAEAGLLPRIFGEVASTRRTPWVAILVVGAMTMAMSFVGDVSLLADTTVLLLVLVFISANISVLILKKDKVEHAYFRTPAIVSVLALVASIALLTQQSAQTWLISAGYVVVGTVLFLIARAARNREGEPADEAPVDLG